MPSIDLTEKNVQLLKAVVEVMKADINFEAVADKADMKTAKYARDEWAKLRKKLIGADGEGEAKPSKATVGSKRKDSAGSTPAPTPKKVTASKAKTATPQPANKATSDKEMGTTIKGEPAEQSDFDDTFE